MKTYRTFSVLTIMLLAIQTGCKENDDNQILPCEIIANAQSSHFVKVINRSSSQIAVDFGTLPFRAIMRVNACELTGLTTGSHYVEITRCEGKDGNCSPFGPTIREDFILNNGETYTITVTDSNF